MKSFCLFFFLPIRTSFSSVPSGKCLDSEIKVRPLPLESFPGIHYYAIIQHCIIGVTDSVIKHSVVRYLHLQGRRLRLILFFLVVTPCSLVDAYEHFGEIWWSIFGEKSHKVHKIFNLFVNYFPPNQRLQIMTIEHWFKRIDLKIKIDV
jgi:hypothetical protein